MTEPRHSVRRPPATRTKAVCSATAAALVCGITGYLAFSEPVAAVAAGESGTAAVDAGDAEVAAPGSVVGAAVESEPGLLTMGATDPFAAPHPAPAHPAPTAAATAADGRSRRGTVIVRVAPSSRATGVPTTQVGASLPAAAPVDVPDVGPTVFAPAPAAAVDPAVTAAGATVGTGGRRPAARATAPRRRTAAPVSRSKRSATTGARRRTAPRPARTKAS